MKIEGFNKRNSFGGFDVFVDGKLLSPKESQKITNHSPDGFSWGYYGSGPAQLALALTIYAAKKMKIDVNKTMRYHQDLKTEFVANLPIYQDFCVEFDLIGWLNKKIKDE